MVEIGKYSFEIIENKDNTDYDQLIITNKKTKYWQRYDIIV